MKEDEKNELKHKYQTEVQSLSKLSSFISTTEPQFHIHRLAKI